MAGLRPLQALIPMALAIAGCEQAPRQVAGPFYLDTRPESHEVALYRCPRGPSEGCAIDELPVLNVIAAGGNERFIAIETYQGFCYFRRVDQERSGWGRNPEMVVGPVSEAAFLDAKRKLGLPDLNVRR